MSASYVDALGSSQYYKEIFTRVGKNIAEYEKLKRYHGSQEEALHQQRFENYRQSMLWQINDANKRTYEHTAEFEKMNTWITIMHDQQEMFKRIDDENPEEDTMANVMCASSGDVDELGSLEMDLVRVLRKLMETHMTATSTRYQAAHDIALAELNCRKDVANHIQNQLTEATKKFDAARQENSDLREECDRLDAKKLTLSDRAGVELIQNAKKHQIAISEWKEKKERLRAEIKAHEKEIYGYKNSSAVEKELARRIQKNEEEVTNLSNQYEDMIKAVEQERVVSQYVQSSAMANLGKDLKSERTNLLANEKKETAQWVKLMTSAGDKSVKALKTELAQKKAELDKEFKKNKEASVNEIVETLTKAKEMEIEKVRKTFEKHIEELQESLQRNEETLMKELELRYREVTRRNQNLYCLLSSKRDRIAAEIADRDLEMNSVRISLESAEGLVVDVAETCDMMRRKNMAKSSMASENDRKRAAIMNDMKRMVEKSDMFLEKARLMVNYYERKLQKVVEKNRDNKLPPIPIRKTRSCVTLAPPKLVPKPSSTPKASPKKISRKSRSKRAVAAASPQETRSRGIINHDDPEGVIAPGEEQTEPCFIEEESENQDEQIEELSAETDSCEYETYKGEKEVSAEEDVLENPDTNETPNSRQEYCESHPDESETESQRKKREDIEQTPKSHRRSRRGNLADSPESAPKQQSEDSPRQSRRSRKEKEEIVAEESPRQSRRSRKETEEIVAEESPRQSRRSRKETEGTVAEESPRQSRRSRKETEGTVAEELPRHSRRSQKENEEIHAEESPRQSRRSRHQTPDGESPRQSRQSRKEVEEPARQSRSRRENSTNLPEAKLEKQVKSPLVEEHRDSTNKTPRSSRRRDHSEQNNPQTPSRRAASPSKPGETYMKTSTLANNHNTPNCSDQVESEYDVDYSYDEDIFESNSYLSYYESYGSLYSTPAAKSPISRTPRSARLLCDCSGTTTVSTPKIHRMNLRRSSEQINTGGHIQFESTVPKPKLDLQSVQSTSLIEPPTKENKDRSNAVSELPRLPAAQKYKPSLLTKSINNNNTVKDAKQVHYESPSAWKGSDIFAGTRNFRSRRGGHIVRVAPMTTHSTTDSLPSCRFINRV